MMRLSSEAWLEAENLPAPGRRLSVLEMELSGVD
jgi:hypothetical protein